MKWSQVKTIEIVKSEALQQRAQGRAVHALGQKPAFTLKMALFRTSIDRINAAYFANGHPHQSGRWFSGRHASLSKLACTGALASTRNGWPG
jgi:hypothetical protein